TWVIRLPMSSDDLMKEIRGNKVAFQDCFISNLAFLLTFPMITMPEQLGDLPLTLPPGSPLISTWLSCIPTFAVLVTDKDTFQTNNSFHTWTRLRVPPGVLSDAERHNVTDVALFNSGIIFLINGAIYLKTRRTFEKLGPNKGAPDTEIIGIKKRRWCQIRYIFKLTTFFQKTNYESVNDYLKLQDKNMGIVLVQFRPSEFSKTCPMAKKVLEIAVGCDANKHIQVKGFNRTECQRRDFSYVIDKEYLRDNPPENLKIRYDVGKYGCPRRLEFNKPFHPIIELHNENGFVSKVTANFIVWEIHGRNDYTFNYTMKQNYRPCFSYAIGKPGDLNQPYEILNMSNKNHLLWPMDHAGMYVFRVKILDPNFSFCNLTTIFAIETFGVIPRPSLYLVAAFVFVLMLTLTSVLVLSYFWYAKIYRQFIFEPLQKPPEKLKKS
ncbi:hypothetical protein STEG23_000010, partial [Scotinomys teguina]